MKRLTCAALAALMFATVAHAEWYKGGNLHRSNGEYWHQATRDNKIATSADFITASSDRLRISTPNRDELYFQSLELVGCINDIFEVAEARHLQISEVAVLCMVELEWLR